MQQIEFRRGFTLIELLLVIFLVGLFAYLVFATPGKIKAPKEKVTIANFPKFLQKNLSGDGEIVCIDKCKTCYYITGSAKPQITPIPNFIRDVKNEYILDRSDNLVRVELGRYKDKKICLRLRHYKNGSLSQVILDMGNKVIYIPSYFGEGKEFGSINEAADWWTKDSSNILRSRGDWY